MTDETFRAKFEIDLSDVNSPLLQAAANLAAFRAGIDKTNTDLVALATRAKASAKAIEAANKSFVSAINPTAPKVAGGSGSLNAANLTVKVTQQQLAANKAAEKSATQLAATVDAGNRKMEAGYARVTSAVRAYSRAASGREFGKSAQADWDAQFASINKVAIAERALAANGDPFAGHLDSLRNTAEYTDLIDRSVQGLSNQRYALYDVASSLGIVSAALLAIPAASVAVGASFESAFASVQRTTGLTGDELDAMQKQLVGISQQLPTSFGDITGVATLGAQLGIANDDLAAFTETVVKFSATTDVSTEAAATGFGRLAQLTKTPQAEISNLASAIYETGINSVATESDILSMAQELAVAGNISGFTQTQIIGLSSALASLGVAPEQARSAVLRIFNDLSAAATDGGEQLVAFAKTAGMSAQEFAQAWSSDPQKAFSAYLKGLSKVSNAQSTLRDQGFTNVRDINVLTRLSKNLDVYNQALSDSDSAYKENTALANGYAIVAETLSSKLTILGNDFKALIAAFGEQDSVKVFVDLLARIIKNLTSLASNPAVKVFATIALAITAIAGALAGGLAGFALYRASLFAVATAMRSYQQSTESATLGLRALLIELAKGTVIGRAFGVTMASAAGETAAAGEAAGASATGFRTAGIAATGFSVALKGLLISSGIGIALAALPTIINAIGKAFESNSDKAKNFFGDSAGLVNAIQQDTAAYGKGAAAISTFQGKVSSGSKELAPWAKALGDSANAQVALGDATADASQKIDTQTYAISANTQKALANMIANSKQFQDAWKKNGDAAQAAGFSIQGMYNAALKNPGSGAQTYLNSLADSYQKVADANKNVIATQAGAVIVYNETGQKALDTANAIRSFGDAAKATDGELGASTDKLKFLKDVAAATGVPLKDLGVQMDTTGESANEMGDATESAAEKLNNMATAALAPEQSLAAVNDALYQIGEGLAKNGNDFTAFSENGRANLQNLQGAVSALAQQANGDSTVFANSIIGLIESLQSQGVDTKNQLGSLFGILNSLVGTKWSINFNTDAARTNIANFLNDAATGLSSLQFAYNAAFSAMTGFNKSAIQSVGVLKPEYQQLAQQALTNTDELYNQIGAQVARVNAAAGAVRASKDVYKATTAQIKDGYTAGKTAVDKATGATQKNTKAAKDNKAANEKAARTLVDYANDLNSVFDRDYELHFGVQQSKDDTANQFSEMLSNKADLKGTIADDKSDIADLKAQWKDATLSARQYQQTINGLKSSNKVLEYQLKVAKKYGDTVRANEIQSQISQNNADITEATNNRNDATNEANDIAKKQSEANKKLIKDMKDYKAGLKGNSEQARKNRKAMEDLTQSYYDQLVEMAKNGASQKQLKEKAAQFESALKSQGRQLGYTAGDMKPYTDALSDLPSIINKIPKNVTVKTTINKPDTSPAQQAINEFLAKNKNKSVTATVKTKLPSTSPAYNSGKAAGGHYTSGFNKRPTPSSKVPTKDGYSAGKSHGTSYGSGWITAANGQRRIYKRKDKSVPGGYVYRSAGSDVQFFNKGGQVKYLSNGFVPRGTDTVPAMLTPGEGVVNKAAMSAYGGADFINAINNLRLPMYAASGYDGGGSSSGGNGPTLVELLPSQIRQLAQAVSTVLTLDSKVVAKGVNDQNRNASVRGAH